MIWLGDCYPKLNRKRIKVQSQSGNWKQLPFKGAEKKTIDLTKANRWKEVNMFFRSLVLLPMSLKNI